MNSFTIEIWEDEYDLVTYYSVRKDGATDNETNTFIRQGMEMHDEALKEDFWDIISLIDDLGKRKGAKKRYFKRYANHSTELPPKGFVKIDGIGINYSENSLRLFCTRVSDNIVVLYNGGIKTSQATQDSPDLSMKFLEANHFSKRIWEEIISGMIIVDEPRHRLICAQTKKDTDFIIF